MASEAGPLLKGIKEPPFNENKQIQDELLSKLQDVSSASDYDDGQSDIASAYQYQSDSSNMPTNADAILQSLLGEVQTNFSGNFDVSDIVSKSNPSSRIQISPPKLFMEDSKEKEKREKRRKERHHSSSKHSSSKLAAEKPWHIEPIKKMMPPDDDLPVGADFQLFHPKIRDDPDDAPSKKSKKKKKESSKKKKKKTKEDEQKESLGLVPRSLSMKNLPPSESKKSKKDMEDGEIGDYNNGWMSLSAEKAKGLETTDEYLKRKLDKAHKKKKRKDKDDESSSRSKDKKDDEKSATGSKRHKSKKDSSKEKSKSKEDKKEKDKSKVKDVEKPKSSDKDKDKDLGTRDHHRHEHKRSEERSRDDRLKSTGSLPKPLSPKKDSSDKSKILPSSWTSSANHESSRDNHRSNQDASSSTRHQRHSDEKDNYYRNSVKEKDFDKEKEKNYSIPNRRDRSRSRTPAVGRGRNFFRRTDAEWREHQVERIRKRKQSPVKFHKEDYMDKYGNIDKKKLMDVATRNVTKLAMSGALPKGYELLATIKNKSIQQLVDLCQQLHDDDERARFGRPSSSESDGDEDNRYCGGWENDTTFSHREVKEAPKPQYEMIDGTAFLVKTEEEQRHEDSFLRVSYPVSSGMEHRNKEGEPAEDEIVPLALSTALARIKTNIPAAFINSFESQMLPLLEPMKPLPLPPPEPPSKTFTDFTASLSSSTGQKQEFISNIFGKTETLLHPIEMSIPTSMDSKAISPVIPAKKPLMIRASFLKSGKKAAEEVLKKILPGPEPVSAPDVSLFPNSFSENSERSSNQIPIAMDPIPLPYNLSLDPVLTVQPEKVPEKPKEITHSDALSAILDRVDQLMTQGKMKEMATVEKKDLTALKTPEKLIENYVKVPDGGISKRKKEVSSESSKSKKHKKDKSKASENESVQKEKQPMEEKMEISMNEETKESSATEEKPIEDKEIANNQEMNDGEVKEQQLEDEPKPSSEEKSKEKKKKKEKKEKKRKHEAMEEGEIREKKPRKSSSSSARLEVRISQKPFGPEMPDVKPRPLPAGISNEFDYRSPLPFIKALTAPQLAIEAAPSGSLKAEWNDPRNPLVASIKDDESLPLPFRIIPPTVQPLVKPEDLVFKTPRCITHPPRMINELVSRRAKYSIMLQQDPNDRYARRQIEDIDRDMSAWAESKNIPGRFTGRTGARVLSVDELAPSDPRYNSWARRDLFSNAPEHESEFGKKILESMGWQKGAGLGRKMNGPREPLSVDIKADRRGLSTGNEKGSGRREAVQDINGKNAVSLVMEYTARQRVLPPTFTCIESGPSTARRFLWKCTIDGVEYEPSMPATNKKAGKSQVCLVVLQSLGLVPPVLPT